METVLAMPLIPTMTMMAFRVPVTHLLSMLTLQKRRAGRNFPGGLRGCAFLIAVCALSCTGAYVDSADGDFVTGFKVSRKYPEETYHNNL